MERLILKEKLIPCFNINGNEMNNVKDGNTSQKIQVDKELIFDTSLVSMYTQSMARTETIGIDAKIAPAREPRLAISEMITTNPVVTMILIR